jgi:putative addiction module antidote
MITQQLRRSGNSLVVTIPKEEVERLNLREGQTVAIDLTPMELKPVLPPEIVQILEETREQATPVMKYLADN